MVLLLRDVHIVRPSPRLSEHVWGYVCRVPQDAMPATSESIDAVLPATFLNALVVVQRSEVRWGPGRQRMNGLSIVGGQSRPLQLSAPKHAEWVAVVFHVGAVSDLLSLSPDALCNGVHDVGTVLAEPDHVALREGLARATPSAVGAIAALEAFLTDRLTRVDPYQQRLVRGFCMAMRSLQSASVSELARTMHSSSKTVVRRSMDLFGMNPKLVLRVARMHGVLERLHRLGESDALSFADLAHEVGFVDQAHFAREFRALVGDTPASIRREVRAGRRVNWSAVLAYLRGPDHATSPRTAVSDAAYQRNLACPLPPRPEEDLSPEFISSGGVSSLVKCMPP